MTFSQSVSQVLWKKVQRDICLRNMSLKILKEPLKILNSNNFPWLENLFNSGG